MKTKNIILIAFLVLLAGLVSCKKDHDIPTGTVFNEGYGGGTNTDTIEDFEGIFVGTWGVEKIEYYNIDYAGNPISSSMETYNFVPGDAQNGIDLIFRADKTGEIRDRSQDTLKLDWNSETQTYETIIICPDTTLVKRFTYSYDKSASILYMNMENAHTYNLKVSDLTYNSFKYECEYATNYMEKPYLKRLSDEPLSFESYTVSISANPSNGGTVNGSGTYQQGQSCTVTATANEGYTFINWTENGNQVSTNVSYTFTVTSNRTLIAIFSASTPLTSTFIEWIRKGPNNLTEEEMANYGLVWTSNYKEVFATIQPLNSDVFLYLCDGDDFYDIETISDKNAYFTNLAETGNIIEKYRNISVTNSADYNDMLAVIYGESLFLIHITHAEIEWDINGTQITITGEVK